MSRIVALVLVVVCLVMTVGCATAVRPVPREITKQRVMDADFDTVWRAAVLYASESTVPVTTIERESGLIVLQQHGYRPGECDEGQLGPGEIVVQRIGNGNITVRPGEGGIVVRVNLTHKAQLQHGNGSQLFPFRYYWIETYSLGEIEQRVLGGIESAAVRVDSTSN